MKRLLLAIAAIAVAATFIPLASASGPYDYVVGAGERATDTGVAINHFSVAAHDSNAGVTGQYQRHTIGQDTELTVDLKCLYVVGNQAVVGGVIRHAVNAPELEGVGFAVAFEDNGHPVGGVTPDRVSSFDFFVEPGRTPPMTQADCMAESFLFALFHPMASGNVKVYDAP